MLDALLGLLASVSLYLGAIYGMVWSSSQRVKAAENRGVTIDAGLSFPSASEIARRHSIEWTIGFAVFFVILAVAGFPLWQRLGIAGVLAIAYGSMWLAQSEPGETAEAASLIQRIGSNTWYWLLAVGDWLGFLAVLCFATDILVSLIK